MAIAPESLPMVVPADGVRGPSQGNWTYKDYLTLPDSGPRYELVDGVLFMTPSPSRWHQEATLEIAHHLVNYMELTGIGKVYIAPLDVLLAPGVVVQPDVLVILNANREKIMDKCIMGAPDLVIEVALPGSVGYDRRDKQDAYARAGVTEYWIVDPIWRTVEVLVLQKDEYQTRGVFTGKVTLPSKVVAGFSVSVEQFFV